MERVDIDNIDRITKTFFQKNIFDNEYLYYFFNQLELKHLLKEKALLSKDDSFVMVHKEVPKREDNLNYILAIKGKVKYHKNVDCPALHKGFKNFFMPEPVVRLKEENEEKYKIIIQDVRKWFQENNFTIERYERGDINDKKLTRSFNAIFPKKYNIEEIIISQNAKNQFRWFIERKSTGTALVDKSFNYDKFIGEIAELIKRRSHLCGSKTMYNLSRYDFLRNKDDWEIKDKISKSITNGFLRDVSENFIENYGLPRLKKFWNEHYSLKRTAMEKLSDYFKWTYNYNLETFSEVFLEDFNLEKCRLCYDNGFN